MTLTAKPKSWLSWDYHVWKDGEYLCLIDLAWVRERGVFDLQGKEYEVGKKSLLGDFMLFSRGRPIARASLHGLTRRKFHLHFEDRDFLLTPASFLSRSYIVEENGQAVGSISSQGWWSRKLQADLEDARLPLEVEVFASWLVVIMWRRMAANSSS